MHQTPGSLRPSRLVRCAGFVASVLALALLPSAGTSAATPKPVFEQVGSLDRFASDARAALGSRLVPNIDDATVTQRRIAGTGIMLPKVRQFWQFYPVNNPTTTMGIVIRDLDTLQIMRTFVFDSEVRRTSLDPEGGGDWAHAVDSTGTRLWLLDIGLKFLYEFDLRTFAMGTRQLPSSLSPSLFPFNVGGMTYDPYEDDLVLIYGGPAATSVAHVNTLVLRLDVTGPPPATFPAEHLRTRLYRFRSCTAPVTSIDSGSDTSNWDMLITKDYLYVPCQRAGHTVVVIRTPRPQSVNAVDHPEDVVAGPVYGDSVFADPVAGRLIVNTYTREIWVFETSTMAFVGVVATGPDGTHNKTGYGLDPVTGRVFFQSSTFGLGVVEGRFFPIPQARTMPRLVSGQERIWSDAATRRVFVLEGDNFSNTPTKARSYRIYTTDPAPLPPTAPDPDRNTTDTAEREGVTEPRWNASGSGYGSRVLLAKGYATVAPGPTLGTVAPTAPVAEGLKGSCGYTDRDLFAGRVAKTEYDTGSTAAQAIAMTVDGATQQDLNQPSRCGQLGLLAPVVPKWTYTSAACASSDGTDEQKDDGDTGGSRDLGPSTVSCPRPGGMLTARAESRVTGLVEVDRSWTETTIERLANGAVQSTVTAVAQGVAVGDLHIGEIRSKAVSSSNGRPKRPNLSTHEITIADVRLGDTRLCDQVCADPEKLERDLNTLAGSRALFRTGHGPNSGRDRTLLEGSPRGAQTAVQKSVARQASDRALVGDFTVEVPALEVTVFNDNTSWGRARQIYQFAGVASSATYNIVLRPTFAPFDDDPGLSDEPSVGESTPFAGLVEAVGGDNEGDFALPTARVVREGGSEESGGLAGVFKAVARGIRLFFSDPRHALLLLTAWALLGSPAVLSRRRRLLAGIRNS